MLTWLEEKKETKKKDEIQAGCGCCFWKSGVGDRKHVVGCLNGVQIEVEAEATSGPQRYLPREESEISANKFSRLAWWTLGFVDGDLARCYRLFFFYFSLSQVGGLSPTLYELGGFFR